MFKTLVRWLRRSRAQHHDEDKASDVQLDQAHRILANLEERADRIVPQLQQEKQRNHFADRLRHTFAPHHRGA